MITRRQIRYLLRRCKTREEGGVKLPPLPKGFRASFEKQDKFRGWLGYQVVWDVDESGWGIVLLDVSAEEAWNKLLMEKVPELPEKLHGVESNVRSDH
jgi:hypothetical protein